MRRWLTMAAMVLTAGLGLSACADPVNVDAAANSEFNLGPEQNPVRSEANPELVAAVPDAIAADGMLTVGSLVTPTPPLVMMATDNATPIGSEIDLARLVADKLGLALDIELTSWDSWPLKLDAGDYEMVHANVGITEPRLESYDFSTNRAAFIAFQSVAGSDLAISEPADIAGLRLATTAGTNQERIMLEWNDQLRSEGKDPAELYYYVNENDMVMALISGRIDAIVGPNASATYRANNREDLGIAGRISAGWPDETLVSSTMQRGNGLAPVVTAAYNELMAEGTYLEVLERWGLEDEALPESKTHSLEEYTDVRY